MMKRQTRQFWLNVTFLFWLTPAFAFAATEHLTPHIKTMDQLAKSYERDEIIERLASEFSDFFGSQQSAEAVMIGLRDSKPVLLPQTVTESSMTIRFRTKPMSLANAYIAMSLVKMHLAQFGISRPTPSQIKIAFNGGGFTQTFSNSSRNIRLKGALTRRATGQSWETIAKLMGVNSDTLSYSMQATNASLKTHTAVITVNKPSPFFGDVTEEETVVQQASVAPSQEVQRNVRARKFGAGIVTAGGGTPEGINSIHSDNSEGIVTAGGGFIPSSSSNAYRGSGGGL